MKRLFTLLALSTSSLEVLPVVALTLASRNSNSTAAVATNALLPSNGHGSSYAAACDSAKQSWLDNGSSKMSVLELPTATVSTVETSSTPVYSVVYSTTTYLRNATPYTLCDGYPRLDGRTSISTITLTSWMTSIFTTLTTDIEITTKTLDPAPSCIIAESDCSALESKRQGEQAVWNASANAWRSQYDNFIAHLTHAGNMSRSYTGAASPSASSPRAPACGLITAPPVPTETLLGMPSCAEGQAPVVLWYWAVFRAPGNLCGGNLSTVTMNETIPGKPNTISTFGTMFTSPTVYLQLPGTWAYNIGDDRTTVTTGAWFPQSSDAISSFCADSGRNFVGESQAAYPVNFGDFDRPVPAKAYRCQPSCHSQSTLQIGTTVIHTNWISNNITNSYFLTRTIRSTLSPENWCSTIWDDYAPALSIPQEILSIQLQRIDGMTTCDFQVYSDNLLFDPPRPLTEVSSIAGVTTPNPNPAAATTIRAPTVSIGPATSSIESVVGSTSSATPTGTLLPNGPSDSMVGVVDTAVSALTVGKPDISMSPSTSTVEKQSTASDTMTQDLSAGDNSVSPQSSALLSQPSSMVYTDELPSSYRATLNSPTSSRATTTDSEQKLASIILSAIGIDQGSMASTNVGAASTDDVSNFETTTIRTTSTADPAEVLMSLLDGTQPSESPSNVAVDPIATSAAPANGYSHVSSDDSVPALPFYTIFSKSVAAHGTSALTIPGGASLVPGGSAITLSGTVVSLASSAAYLVVGDKTITPELVPTATDQSISSYYFATGLPFLVWGDKTALTVEGGVTLSPGGPPVTLANHHTVSLATDASYLLVDGNTVTPSLRAASGDHTTASTSVRNAVSSSNSTSNMDLSAVVPGAEPGHTGGSASVGQTATTRSSTMLQSGNVGAASETPVLSPTAEVTSHFGPTGGATASASASKTGSAGRAQWHHTNSVVTGIAMIHVLMTIAIRV